MRLVSTTVVFGCRSRSAAGPVVASWRGILGAGDVPRHVALDRLAAEEPKILTTNLM